MLLFQRVTRGEQARKSFPKHPWRDGRVELSFDPGVAVRAPDASSTTFKWSDIQRATRASAGMVLFPGARTFLWIPRHAIESSQVGALEQLLHVEVKGGLETF